MTTFIAVDGEAIGGNTDARYALLATSTGKFVWNLDGLKTEVCFDFLCGQQTPGVELVCFGLGYDINQWLADVPENTLRELWSSGSCFWKYWRLVWTAGRRFEIYNRRNKRFAIVQECFGFFQQSFVKALTEWGFDVPAELAAMKQQRGRFTETMKRQVIDYCFSECRLLVSLMDRLAEAAETAGCKPKPHWWIGAGQLASAMLAANGVQAHHRHDSDILENTLPIMSAYYGGRAELLRQGERSGVNTYDLRSAYPWAATHLRSLSNVRAVKRRRHDPSVEHGIWHTRWEGLPGNIMPFPVRCDKAIWYPRTGEGWYHAVEVNTALAAGFQLDIREGIEFRSKRTEGDPFAFIPGQFAARRKYQQTDNPAQRVLKLALNSLYGKTAQGVAGLGRPRWQSYIWAGEITARTRARMLTLALKAKDPMMIATDGLFCGQAPARPGKQIGGWEHGRLDWLFAAQPGVYQGTEGDREVLRSRGFFVADIDYDELHAGWAREGPDYVHTYTSHRFIGLGQALQRKTGLGPWRQWVDQDRSLYLMPQRKVLSRDPRSNGWVCLPVENAPGPSEPYHPKIRLLESQDDDNQAGLEQPLRSTL
jgi:DNA polymerase type B, organellar and viral